MALLTINDTADVILLKPSTDPNNPWVVLCYDHGLAAKGDPWVVWYAADDGNTITGGYHGKFEEAKQDFASRPTGVYTP